MEELYGGGEDDEDDADYDIDSVLDHIDEVVFFAEALEALRSLSTKAFDALMRALNNKDKGMLQDLGKEATRRKQEQQNKPQ